MHFTYFLLNLSLNKIQREGLFATTICHSLVFDLRNKGCVVNNMFLLIRQCFNNVNICLVLTVTRHVFIHVNSRVKFNNRVELIRSDDNFKKL